MFFINCFYYLLISCLFPSRYCPNCGCNLNSNNLNMGKSVQSFVFDKKNIEEDGSAVTSHLITDGRYLGVLSTGLSISVYPSQRENERVADPTNISYVNKKLWRVSSVPIHLAVLDPAEQYASVAKVQLKRGISTVQLRQGVLRLGNIDSSSKEKKQKSKKKSKRKLKPKYPSCTEGTVYLGSNPSLHFEGNCTIELWFRFDEKADIPRFPCSLFTFSAGDMNQSSEPGMQLTLVNSNRLQWISRKGTQASMCSIDLSADVLDSWIHIALSFDSSTRMWYAYVNGSEVSCFLLLFV